MSTCEKDFIYAAIVCLKLLGYNTADVNIYSYIFQGKHTLSKPPFDKENIYIYSLPFFGMCLR